MSLILEALRKSEAERRRGATPSLYAEMPPVPTKASRFDSRWPVWIGLAALVPVAAWIALGLVRSDPAPLVANKPMAEPTPALAPVQHLEASTVVPIIRPESPPVTDQAPVAGNAPPDASPTPADDEPQTAADLAASIAARAQAAAARDDRDAAEPAPAPASAMTSPQRALSLTDLSTDERKALPPLKMSMHLWNEDASRRFVIIDGERLHEGDRIGNAVVAAIVSDGVLLDWNGRQLKLPIR
jgi:general secretion pathway protein B